MDASSTAASETERLRGEELWLRAHEQAERWLRRYSDVWTRAHRDDLAQEASIAAWRWASDGRPCWRLRAAVRTITTRLRSRALRGERRELAPDVFPEWMPCLRDEPGELRYTIAGRRVPAPRARAWLATALRQLPALDRALLLGFHEGFCCAELADRFRRSLACVKTRLHRARRRVQREVEGRARAAGDLDA